MEKFIKEKMNLIFEDFKKDLDDMGKFCELKKFRFDSGHTPDYSNPLMQRFYLLKYLPAYLTEYCVIYYEMLETNFIGNNLNIISFGCGCGIDYWGLKFVADDNIDTINISYTGIDKTRWNYTDKLNNGNVSFINADINKIGKLKGEEYNVIMFPKSIGELDVNTFEELKNIIRNSKFNSDKIILLSSVRKSRSFVDVPRLSEVVAILKNNHQYECLDDKDVYKCWEPDENGIYPRFEEVCDEFVYPQHIKNFITSLNSKCQGYNSKSFGACEDDCDIMERSPILRASQTKYQVLRLQKR